MSTGTYPISTAFHSFKKAQFQLQDPDPDPDWRFESGSTRIRIRNTDEESGPIFKTLLKLFLIDWTN